MFGVDERAEALPPNPTGAMLIAMVYVRLGGSFSIGSNGKRYMGQPFFNGSDELPQLPKASPSERFHNPDEWQGAMKLLSGLMGRMDRDDREAIFYALATIAVDERKFVPSIDEPKRVVS